MRPLALSLLSLSALSSFPVSALLAQGDVECSTTLIRSAACYDEARQRLVFAPSFSPIWEYDGQRFGHRPLRMPQTVHSLVYDPVRRRSFLFGQLRTYSYDGYEFVDLGVSEATGAVVDTARARLVSIRGFGAAVQIREWDESGWRIAATFPSSILINGGAYDPDRRVTVLSGLRLTPPILAETWEWNGTSLALRGTTQLQHYPAVFDPVSRRILSLEMGGLWAWDGANWALVGAPPPFTGGGLLVDTTRGVLLSSDGEFLWSYDGATWRREVSLPHPTRTAPGLTFDAARGRVVLFGGESPSPSTGFGQTADLFTWDGDDWQWIAATATPPARSYHAQIYDAARGRTVVFGGRDALGVLGDTWTWDGSNWRQETPAVAPPPRSDAMIAWEAARSRVVLLGGRSAVGLLADHWEWDGSAWTQVAATTPLGPVRGAMGHDPARGVLVAVTDTGDTWEQTGGGWVQRATGGRFPESPRLEWNAGRQRLQANLYDPAGTRYAEWDGTQWVDLGAGAGQLVYDAARDRMLHYSRGRFTAVTSTPGLATPFGDGCVHASAPTFAKLSAFRRPIVGDAEFHLDVQGAAPLSPAAIGFGFAQGAVPLGNGCTLLVQQAFHTVLWFTDASGNVHQPLPLPNVLALRGTTLFAQAAVLDVRAPGGFTTSPGLRIALGD